MQIDQDKLVEKLLDILAKNSETMSKLTQEVTALRNEVARLSPSIPQNGWKITQYPGIGVVNLPYIATQSCQHEYPLVSNFSFPPCIKCGQIQGSMTISSSGNVAIGSASSSSSSNKITLCNTTDSPMADPSISDLLAELGVLKANP